MSEVGYGLRPTLRVAMKWQRNHVDETSTRATQTQLHFFGIIIFLSFFWLREREWKGKEKERKIRIKKRLGKSKKGERWEVEDTGKRWEDKGKKGEGGVSKREKEKA